MRHVFSAAIVILWVMACVSSHACTIVMLSKGDVVLVGNNEDWKNPFTCCWFIPAGDGEYGRACFGFADPFENPQGGINDQGLFIDANGISSTGWEPVEGKPTFRGSVMEHVLARCATVAEAVAFFEANNVPDLNNGRFPIADRTGASVVVEWAQGEVQFLRASEGFQVSTNFIVTNFEPGTYPCYRYNLAVEMLRAADEYSVDLVKSVLSAVHFEGQTATLYSNIFDLKRGDIYIYNFHDFTEGVRLSLEEELQKGKRAYHIPGLFSRITYANRQFIPSGASELLLNLMRRKGLEYTIEEFEEIREICLEAFNEDFVERIVNDLGYDLLGFNKHDEAIKVFQYNTIHYPGSANAYDSLGEAYMIHGEKELAIQNYRKSLELNPGNSNAREMLKKLEE
jgi:tetratricopeptide (TPR) repeat protein